jgi:L-asparaginase II
MAPLLTESRLPDPDRAYRRLVDAHRGLSDEASAALNTRLVLILMNHLGDEEVLAEAIALAKQAGDDGAALRCRPK